MSDNSTSGTISASFVLVKTPLGILTICITWVAVESTVVQSASITDKKHVC
jgi:hypothetical protein